MGHCVKGFAAGLRFTAGDAENTLCPRVVGDISGYPAAVGEQRVALIGGVKGVPAYVIIGAVHAQKIQHRGQEVRGVQRLVHLHGLQIRAPDEAGRLFQQQGIAHPGKGVQGRFVLVAVGVVVSDTDDNGVVKLSLVLQLLKQPGKQIVHQLGLEIGAVRFLVAGKPPEFRVLFQRPIAQDFIVLVAQMGRTGDDEVQGWLSLPEEFGIQTGIVKQQLIVIQKVFLVRADVIPIADVFRIPHGGREHAAAVEAGVIIMDTFSG